MKKLLTLSLILLAWSLPTKTTSCTTKVFDVLVNICCKEEVVAGYYKEKLEKQILKYAPKNMVEEYNLLQSTQQEERKALLNEMAQKTLSPEKFKKYNYVKDKW